MDLKINSLACLPLFTALSIVEGKPVLTQSPARIRFLNFVFWEGLFKAEKWLKKAFLKNANVDISNCYLIWEDGVWKDGFWKGGVWIKGKMWNNLDQCFIEVKQKIHCPTTCMS